MLSWRTVGVAALTASAALATSLGCADGGETSSSTAPSIVERSAAEGKEQSAAETVAPSHCRAGLPSCRTTEGRITFVERVDPDGDGDAHFVIVDPQGITLPGLTAIDVRAGLRPRPLPGIGDLISAAGPVQ